MSYTKGPWKHIPNTPYVESDDCIIALVGGLRTTGDPVMASLCRKRWDADTRLIASSPDLLEALKEIVRVETSPMRDRSALRNAYNSARAAIAKAEGHE